MVSNNDNTHLTVIEGMKGKAACTGECRHEATEAKEASYSHDPLDTKHYDEALKRLQLAKLDYEHTKLRAALEDQQRDLYYKLKLEKLTFEAALDGVPVKHIEDSHEQAFEALESAQNRVA